MEETISLKELIETLRKRLALIISITLIAVMTSGIVSYFVLTPIYQSSTQLLVNQAKNENALYSYNEIQTNLQLINTYSVIIKSPAILDKVIDKLDLNMTTSQLNEKISVTSEKNSQVVNVSVHDPDPNVAAELANTVAQVFKKEITQLMNVDNVSILAEATVTPNQSPVKPKPLLNIAIAMVVGLMTGIGIAFLQEYLDNTIKTEEDIEKYLDLPVLGVVSIIEDQKTEITVSRAERKAKLRGETIGS
jgi:capsular polysaccharide biosynthesis protein